MGAALASALTAAGVRVRGPLARGADGRGAVLVILCVPDREIAAAAAAIEPGPMVGHVSASADMALLEPHERFVMHPLLSVVGVNAQGDAHFSGATCAIDASTDRARTAVGALAQRLGMQAREIPASQRALYHAAASVASNYLTTVEAMAERLAGGVGLDRAALVPLVRASVDHWAELGGAASLTGPISRGDEETVTRQRAAVAGFAPDMLDLWNALERATRTLAATRSELRA